MRLRDIDQEKAAADFYEQRAAIKMSPEARRLREEAMRDVVSRLPGLAGLFWNYFFRTLRGVQNGRLEPQEASDGLFAAFVTAIERNEEEVPAIMRDFEEMS